MRFFLEIAYRGDHYNGWQVQPDAPSVQETINKALSQLLGHEVMCTGCGRTDTGVHATQYYLHFDTDKEITDHLVYQLNKVLPADIALYRLIPVADEAHSRFDATERSYEYIIHFDKNPFMQTLGYYYEYPRPDIAKMNQAARLLLGYSDFAPLSKAGSDNKTTICRISAVSLFEVEGSNQLRVRISADRFLRGMVRMIVGCLLNIGRGKLTVEEFKTVMDEGGQFKHILPVPGHGLYLTSVKYPYIQHLNRNPATIGEFAT